MKGSFKMMLEVIIRIGFSGSFNICSDYDKCQLFYYVSFTMTCVSLGFGYMGWDDCGICLVILFQKGILWFKFFYFTFFTDNVV